MQKDTFNVFMPIDVVKSVDGFGGEDAPWVFEGIASTADVDLFGEVVYPESFHNSIEFFKSNGKIFFDHDYAKENANWLQQFGFSKDEILSLKTPLGKPLDAEIRPEGLYIKAMLNKKHPMARKMWDEFLQNSDEEFKSQIGLSIGAKYLGQPRREYDVKKGQYVTYLPDLLLYEVSMTPEPVNPNTKTWAAVLKSMMDADAQDEAEIQFHTIVPDETVYDAERNRLVIKSTVQGGDGITHVFESYVDLKEDIKNAMADKNVTLKAAPGEQDKGKKASPIQNDAKADNNKKNPKPGLSQEVADQGAELAAEGTDQKDNTAGNMPAPDGVAPETENAGVPQDKHLPEEADVTPPDEGGDEGAALADAPAPTESATPDEGADEGAGGVLDTLVGDEEGDGGEGGEDAAQEMILDKLDTMLDLFQTIADALHISGGEEPPVADQVTQEAPNVAATKSIDMDALKSIITETISNNDTVVTLSEESTVQFGEAIKSIFDGFEDRIVEKVVEKLYSETTVVKSTSASANYRSEAAIVHPGAAVDGDPEEQVPNLVRKSVGLSDDDDNSFFSAEQVDTLKSYVAAYRDIRGHTASHSQKRARIVEQAQQELDIQPQAFNHYVKMADRGKL